MGTNWTEAELEGGGSTWWYVCGDCHGEVKYLEDVCHHCKAVLSWEGIGLPGIGLPKQTKRYTGEQTEPAE